MEQNVKILGKRDDINDILSITDIYLASSIREGLGLNIVEAMYKEIPIIATANRGHRELVKDGVNGYLVEADDVDGFAKKAVSIMKSPPVTATIICRSISKYAKDSVIDELKEIYEV